MKERKIHHKNEIICDVRKKEKERKKKLMSKKL